LLEYGAKSVEEREETMEVIEEIRGLLEDDEQS
jgi:hypothetical protein